MTMTQCQVLKTCRNHSEIRGWVRLGEDASFRLNTGTRPIVNKYHKGKLKRTLRWYVCMLEEPLLY